MLVLSETSVPDILATASAVQPSVIIIDSIQTMALPELQSSAGSISQVRESAGEFQRYAKSTGTPVFLIGHGVGNANQCFEFTVREQFGKCSRGRSQT